MEEQDKDGKKAKDLESKLKYCLGMIPVDDVQALKILTANTVQEPHEVQALNYSKPSMQTKAAYFTVRENRMDQAAGSSYYQFYLRLCWFVIINVNVFWDF